MLILKHQMNTLASDQLICRRTKRACMKFKIFFQLMSVCFTGLTAVVGASPLDTTPPITDFFIPVNQRSVEPVRNPGDFIGRVFAPKPEDWQTRPEAQPISGFNQINRCQKI